MFKSTLVLLLFSNLAIESPTKQMPSSEKNIQISNGGSPFDQQLGNRDWSKRINKYRTQQKMLNDYRRWDKEYKRITTQSTEKDTESSSEENKDSSLKKMEEEKSFKQENNQ